MMLGQCWGGGGVGGDGWVAAVDRPAIAQAGESCGPCLHDFSLEGCPPL